MADAKHTPEPWLLDITEHGFRIRMGSTVPYTGIYKPQHLIEWEPGVYYDPEYGPNDAENKQYLEAEANMRRIVACVNACAGIPTEALETGVVWEMVEALEVLVGKIEWEIGEEKWGRDPDALAKAKRVLAKVRGGGAS